MVRLYGHQQATPRPQKGDARFAMVHLSPGHSTFA